MKEREGPGPIDLAFPRNIATRIIARGISILEGINSRLALLAGLILIACMLIITYEVAARYVFNRPTSWSVEISSYALLYMVFVSFAYVLQIDGHIYVEFLVTRLGPRLRNGLDMITSILGLVYAGVLLWKGWELFMQAFSRQWTSMSLLRIPLFPVYIIMPIGSLLLCLALVARFYKKYRAFVESGAEIKR